MSTLTNTTFEVFNESVLSDEDRGYPDDVTFIASDVDDVDELVRRNLRAGRATVVITEHGEILIVPRSDADGAPPRRGARRAGVPSPSPGERTTGSTASRRTSGAGRSPACATASPPRSRTATRTGC